MVWKILFATDGSAASHEALQLAGILAKRLTADLTVAHVFDDMLPNVRLSAPELFMLREHGQSTAEAILKKTQQRLKKLGLRKAAGQLLKGNPAQAIVNFARKGKFDLLIIGTHGRRGFQRFMLGSVAEAIVGQCPIPVLVVNAALKKSLFTRGIRKEPNLLIPLDGTQLDKTSMQFGFKLARSLRAAVHLLYVAQPPIIVPPVGSYYRSSYLKATLDVMEYGRDLLERTTKSQQQKFKIKKIVGKVEKGYPDKQILHYAEKNQMDLIVLSTHGYRGFVKLLLGSVSSAVIRKSTIPVIILPKKLR